MKRKPAIAIVFFLVSAIGVWAAADVPDGVKTLVKQRCVKCHKGKFPPKSLNLEPANFAAVLDRPSSEVPFLKIVDTKAPEASYLLKKVRRESGIVGRPMPPRKALAAEELRVLESWIGGLGRAAGADEVPSSPGGEEMIEPAAPEKSAPKRAYDKPAFWGTRLLNLPTTTTPDKGDFLVRVSHRFFEPVDAGFDDLFGLDSYANILFSLGYGITDNLAVTVGRSRLYKEFEFGADWLIVEQGLTARLPFSAALHGGLSLATEGDDNIKLSAALSLSHQLTRRLSVLVVPAFATNTNHWALASEATFSLGVGARWMVLEDFSLIAEWVPAIAGYKDVESGWGVGVEEKIGGHVFQFFVTNAFGLTASQFIPGGDLRLGDFDFRIGFNIFRTF
jgi:hypothetical protein